MRRLVFVVIMCAVGLPTGCARSSELGSPYRDRDVITSEEVASVRGTTAFEVVERLRPHFLRTRGPTSVYRTTRIIVYQDDLALGGVEMLRQIRSADVQEIRFMSATDATTRFGSDHPAGAIVVTSKAR